MMSTPRKMLIVVTVAVFNTSYFVVTVAMATSIIMISGDMINITVAAVVTRALKHIIVKTVFLGAHIVGTTTFQILLVETVALCVQQESRAVRPIK